MSFGNRRARRRVAAAGLAVLLGGFGLASVPNVAQATPDFALTRLAGATRTETAVEISQDTFPSAALALIAADGVANFSAGFADPLAGNYLAADVGSPILLSGVTSVPQATLDELARLGATNVVLLGGTTALADSVQTQLDALGYEVGRVAGLNRFSTAAAVAQARPATDVGLNENGLKTAVLSSGFAFPDALAAGPIVYADSFPQLLTPDTFLATEAVTAMNALGIEHVILTGGTTAIAPAVETALVAAGFTVERIAGIDRFGTATALADKAIDALGHVDTHTNVAFARNFPDALAGGPHAGVENSTIVLSETTTVDATTCGFLSDRAATMASGDLFGGTVVVTDATKAGLEACAQDEGTGGGPNQTFDVSPTATEATELTGAPGAGTGGEVEYSVDGLEDSGEYDIALFPCGNPFEGPSVLSDNGDYFDLNGASNGGGEISFRDQTNPPFDTADNEGATMVGAAEITSVNGTGTAGQEVNNVVAETDGTLTFTLDSVDVDCAIPVLWSDDAPEGDNDTLDLENNNTTDIENDDTPSDAFGVGGAAVWDFGEAPNGDTMTGDVVVVDLAASTFTLDTGYVYIYGDAGDTYFYDGSEVDELIELADWELFLSIGDAITNDGSTYSQAGNNAFEQDFFDTPGTPGLPTATVGDFDGEDDGDDIRVSWPEPDPIKGDVDQYGVELYDEDGVFLTGRVTPEVDTEGTGDAPTSLADNNIFNDNADAIYYVRVYANSETDDSGDYSEWSAPIEVGTADAGDPTIDSAVLDDDNGTVGRADTGDVWEIIFSEDMAAATATGIFTVEDGDGTTADITCGVTASCVLQDNDIAGNAIGTDQVLVVTLLLLPTPIDAGTTLNLQYPLTITNVNAAVDDEAGNQLDLAGSADDTIN